MVEMHEKTSGHLEVGRVELASDKKTPQRKKRLPIRWLSGQMTRVSALEDGHEPAMNFVKSEQTVEIATHDKTGWTSNKPVFVMFAGPQISCLKHRSTIDGPVETLVIREASYHEAY